MPSNDRLLVHTPLHPSPAGSRTPHFVEGPTTGDNNYRAAEVQTGTQQTRDNYVLAPLTSPMIQTGSPLTCRMELGQRYKQDPRKHTLHVCSILGHTGSYWATLGHTRRYSALLDYTGPYWIILDHTGAYWRILGSTGPTWRPALLTSGHHTSWKAPTRENTSHLSLAHLTLGSLQVEVQRDLRLMCLELAMGLLIGPEEGQLILAVQAIGF